ncbi:MAG: Anthranilate 1,2-dioxygenase system ferredoxin--NAD(+) reductase component [Chlamydiae bacterium]|nr:Anthranilate 1,2-dioxygenase system ferredoxin--NAD(+) reductase component [Chlamydiota bacterium]
MQSHTYLIIGGGMTADAAVRGIREHDFTGSIGLLSEEKHPPYERPPLSKGLWTGKPFESIWKGTEKERITLYLGTRVVSIDPEKKEVVDREGNCHSYEKLLLATGCSPIHLSCPDEEVIYFRTVEDYFSLKNLYERGREFLIVGGGYIGTEIAAAFAMNGKDVTMVFPEPSIGHKKLPQNFSMFLNAFYTEKGVRLVPEQSIQSVTKEGERSRVVTTGGDHFVVDGVIAGIGVAPNVELAEAIGCKVDNGIVVDESLQTSLPDIFSAGDVANFYSPHLEKRIRCEHEDTAYTMGKVAGKNMAGETEAYTHLPYFYSELFELGYEAIGDLSKDMEIIEEWDEPYRTGVLYYLKEGRLRGAMLWGGSHRIDQIREQIASKELFTSIH